jgi:alkaline phosphatase
MQYRLLADRINEPSLLEMTSKALEILKKNDKGFVLLVEGGRIDHAHHETRAQLALHETAEFDKTIEFVSNKTNDEETLMVVTADHSHVFTVGGYPVSRTDKNFFVLIDKIF